MIAALYVQSGGVYFERDDVDPWDENRDARNLRRSLAGRGPSTLRKMVPASRASREGLWLPTRRRQRHIWWVRTDRPHEHRTGSNRMLDGRASATPVLFRDALIDLALVNAR